MFDILADRTYRHLFLAQVVALLGTGLATVALGLLAYDLAGDEASVVLGTVFTIKMIAYVGIAPVAGAFANRVDRKKLFVHARCCTGNHGAMPPFCHRGLAGLRVDLLPAISICRVYTNFSGYNP